MERIVLNKIPETSKKCLVMIFTEGTVLSPKTFLDFFCIRKYQPTKNCIAKIKCWEKQGAEIIYLTSRKKSSNAQNVAKTLTHYGFPGSYLYYRNSNERYSDVVESVRPDILIEDDCRSIGGSWQTAINKVALSMKETITSIIVKEFGGIDHLPDDLDKLISFQK